MIKNNKKRILSFLLAMAMCFSLTSVAFAAELTDDYIAKETITRAGIENWDYTGYFTEFVGSFDMYGRNLTPVKTIVNNSELNRYLTIYTDFSCNSNSILTVQIVEYPSGKVLASSSSNATTSGHVVVQAGPDMAGKQVQILSKVTDAYGNYSSSRLCHISYSYSLSGIGG